MKDRPTVRRFAALCACALATALNGCTAGSFDVTPCALDGKLAFLIHKVDGWFFDYQPRPSSVIVLAEGKGPGSKWPGMWAADLKYYGENDTKFDNRPPRELIVYGQQFPGWEVAQPAKPLDPRTTYSFSVQDSGRQGWARLLPGVSLKPC